MERENMKENLGRQGEKKNTVNSFTYINFYFLHESWLTLIQNIFNAGYKDRI